jgi:hypothetical protein
MHPNLEFWLENKASGNPEQKAALAFPNPVFAEVRKSELRQKLSN